MTYYLGVDPSQRHTGLCIRFGTRAAFYEIKTDKLDILQSAVMIRKAFAKIVEQLPSTTVFCIERQIVAGANYAPLQFYIYQVILEEIFYFAGNSARIVLPAPVQLKQYMSRIHRVDTQSKQGIVDSYHKKYGRTGRKKSSHKVEAYYLTLLGEDCVDGKWYYTYNEKQSRSIPWDPIQGVKPPKKKPIRKRKKNRGVTYERC